MVNHCTFSELSKRRNIIVSTFEWLSNCEKDVYWLFETGNLSSVEERLIINNMMKSTFISNHHSILYYVIQSKLIPQRPMLLNLEILIL
jgi:hypothetical protein